MNIEIPISEQLYKRLQNYCERSGASMDDAVSLALERYIDKHAGMVDDEVTAKLNEFYSEHRAELDPVIIQLSAASIPKDEW